MLCLHLLISRCRYSRRNEFLVILGRSFDVRTTLLHEGNEFLYLDSNRLELYINSSISFRWKIDWLTGWSKLIFKFARYFEGIWISIKAWNRFRSYLFNKFFFSFQIREYKISRLFQYFFLYFLRKNETELLLLKQYSSRFHSISRAKLSATNKRGRVISAFYVRAISSPAIVCTRNKNCT